MGAPCCRHLVDNGTRDMDIDRESFRRRADRVEARQKTGRNASEKYAQSRLAGRKCPQDLHGGASFMGEEYEEEV